MKVRQVIYFIIGIICACIQVSFYLMLLASGGPKITAENRNEPGFLVGYYLGVNLFLIPTILCAIGVYRVYRKLKRRERQELEAFTFDDPS